MRALAVLTLVLLLSPAPAAASLSDLRVTSGVYSDLTVRISDSVPQKNCPQYLSNIEVGEEINYVEKGERGYDGASSYLKNMG